MTHDNIPHCTSTSLPQWNTSSSSVALCVKCLSFAFSSPSSPSSSPTRPRCSIAFFVGRGVRYGRIESRYDYGVSDTSESRPADSRPLEGTQKLMQTFKKRAYLFESQIWHGWHLLPHPTTCFPLGSRRTISIDRFVVLDRQVIGVLRRLPHSLSMTTFGLSERVMRWVEGSHSVVCIC